MAVKASATITLTSYRDTQSVTRYYKLQTAGSSAPSKPTTKPPSSDWTDSEPACDISKELYFCDLTIFSNGEGEYSKVSKSSSYEAAKEAFNRADNAQTSIDNLKIGGRNLLPFEAWSKQVGGVYEKENGTFSITSFANSYYSKPYVFGEVGEIYTISADIATQDTTNPRAEVGIYDGSTFTPKQYIGLAENTLGWVTLATRNDINAVRLNYKTVSGPFIVKNLKIEKGNKATDWTPAPEDVDAGISEAQDNALSAQEEASALDVDLNDFKSNEYSQINDKVGELVEYKGENEIEIGKIREELSQELVAQKFARIEPDKGSLILGEINGTTAVLTNEQFGFYTPNSEIAAAYFGKDNDAWAFNIERGIIKNDLRFSGFQWIARSNKNMSLKWIK